MLNIISMKKLSFLQDMLSGLSIASAAACCSASFFLAAIPLPRTFPLQLTSTVNRFSCSAPSSDMTLYRGGREVEGLGVFYQPAFVVVFGCYQGVEPAVFDDMLIDE